jgi:antitoxin FitA
MKAFAACVSMFRHVDFYGACAMSRLLVRQVDETLVAALKERAPANRRSVEAEHRAILEAVLLPSVGEFARRAAILRSATAGRMKTDSADLIRRDRDER